LVVAWLIDFKYHSFLANGDAISRMANGFYVLYSRDPHLAAIGFVWEPLQSVADMIFLLGNHVWPALSHNDMAGSLASAIGMAGAVYQMCSALREWGVSRAARLTLTAFFALDPMILLYSGNGMSEGIYLFTLVAATRYLLRWMHSGDLRSLAYSAVALGFCYLTRNEGAAAALLGGFAVAAVSYKRARGRRPSRARTAMSDVFIFAAPPFIALAGWAITSYVITGEFFAQISSIYGSAEQERLLGHMTFHGKVVYQVHAIEALAPLLPVLVVAAAAVAMRRRDPRMLAPLTVLGGALGFDMASFMVNGIQNYLRYWIVAIPLCVLLLGCLVAAVQNPRPAPTGVSVRSRSSDAGIPALTTVAAMALILVAMIPTSATTASAMVNPNIGSEESNTLGFIFHSHPSAADLDYKGNYAYILDVDKYFTRLHVPDGDVVVDNYPGCVPAILTTINQPKLFVIPNDRDYQRILADPITFHARFILEADPKFSPNNSINIRYPSLWRTGAGFTKMVHQFPERDGCYGFRLFHVLGHSNQV
jgi:hypothetical protein